MSSGSTKELSFCRFLSFLLCTSSCPVTLFSPVFLQFLLAIHSSHYDFPWYLHFPVSTFPPQSNTLSFFNMLYLFI